MSTSRYFNYAVKSEQDLYENLVIESLQFTGQDVYYIPRTIVNRDKILFDDIPSKFSSAYKIEMYLDNPTGWSGEGQLFSKFGIEIRDAATFVVSKRRWNETVKSYLNDITGDQPSEGDLIYLPMTRSLFEITYVDKNSPFYQLSKFNVFSMSCELFEYSDETLDTGIPAIDLIETIGYEIKLLLDADSDIIPISLGEIVTEALANDVTVSGKVVGWNRDTQVLSVAHIGSSDGKYHQFTVGGQITSDKTAGVRTIRGITEDIGDFGYQNHIFDSDEVGFLDFTENNPFGTPE
jgi:hypothetical protein